MDQGGAGVGQGRQGRQGVPERKGSIPDSSRRRKCPSHVLVFSLINEYSYSASPRQLIGGGGNMEGRGSDS